MSAIIGRLVAVHVAVDAWRRVRRQRRLGRVLALWQESRVVLREPGR